MTIFNLGEAWALVASAADDAVALRHMGGAPIQFAFTDETPTGNPTDAEVLLTFQTVAASNLAAAAVNVYARSVGGPAELDAVVIARPSGVLLTAPPEVSAARTATVVPVIFGDPAAVEWTQGEAITPLDLSALAPGATRWQPGLAGFPPGVGVGNDGVVKGTPVRPSGGFMADAIPGNAAGWSDRAVNIRGRIVAAAGGGGGGAAFEALALPDDFGVTLRRSAAGYSLAETGAGYLAGYAGSVIHVSESGDDGAGDGSSGAPLRSLDAAIAAASDGDRITMSGGVFALPSVTLAKKLAFLASG